VHQTPVAKRGDARRAVLRGSEVHVPQIAVPGEQPQHALPGRSDQDGRPAGPGASRLQHALASFVVAPGEVHLPVAEQPVDDAEPFLEAAHPVVEGKSEGAVLGFVPARAEPEDQPAAGDLLDRVGELREVRGIPEGHARDERPDLYPRGHRRDGGDDGPPFPDALVPLARMPEQQVVLDPDRIEPDLLRASRHQADVRPARRPVASLVHGDGKLHPDLQRPSSLSGHDRSSVIRSAALSRARRRRAVPPA
jgi:hypothetical protein